MIALLVLGSYVLGRLHTVGNYQDVIIKQNNLINKYSIEIDSIKLNLTQSTRLVNSQRRFFHRIVEGKYQYLPAVDACKMCLLGFEKMSVYVPDSQRPKKAMLLRSVASPY